MGKSVLYVGLDVHKMSGRALPAALVRTGETPVPPYYKNFSKQAPTTHGSPGGWHDFGQLAPGPEEARIFRLNFFTK